MKRMVLLVCVILFFTAAIPCASAESGSGLEKVLLGKSIELTMHMDELAESKLYLQMVLSSNDDYSSLAGKIGEGKYDQPEKAMILTLGVGAWREVLARYGVEYGEMSDYLSNRMEEMMCNVIMTFFNAQSGTEMMAVSSMLGAGTSFLSPEGWDGNQIVLLVYDGNYASIAYFVKNENNIVNARASFILMNELVQGSLGSDNGLPGDLGKLGEIEIGKRVYSSDDLAALQDHGQ